MIIKHKFFIITILFVFNAAISSAQESSYKSEFGFISDNDSYLAQGQDRYYTNGLFLKFRTALDQSALKNSKLNKVIWGLEAGQKMYNPQTGSILDPGFIDRPFAAYLYGGGAVNFLFNSESNLKLSIQLGTIGPSAKGKEAQELLHNTFGFYEINGWQWQVNNEFGINSTIEFNKLINRLKSGKTDFSLNTYLNAGNTFAGIGAGILFRTGTINPLHSSASTQSTISNNSRIKFEKEFFFYAKPMLHYIAYDATIQGGMFINDKGSAVFDVKPMVFSQQAGAVFSKNRWTADFSVIFKSREIKSSAKAHQYGSFALLYRLGKE
ncbi:lipid A deacylase LpxR family protein [Daejeonella sp.]|uniref:lipid A deacylase LpxR family protein n=1 Tax=Daejeonella sp. TaxID=2805397 RepID=UPI0026D9F94C|nr:lipid A deacylase LpxR family protein [Daejeonella sp.]HQS04711.1 lipid A deacylase LpxR family protein [Daejeonella sp.]HQT22335.1 lipid A deacylase LpxR family protein [Daejeonella sp.]HQT56824.1 lipid A deacylase LpxR family protein [Daejeonella sp.]